MTTEGPSATRADGRIAAKLDELDRRMVDMLRIDGRISMRALAQRLHISRANAYTRLERLEREGVITGFAATVDPQRYGHALSAYVYLKIAQRSWKSVREKVLQIAEVDHIALLSGEHDIVLLVRTRDAGALRDLVLTRLQEMPEVLGTQTVLIFDEVVPTPVADTEPSAGGGGTRSRSTS